MSNLFFLAFTTVTATGCASFQNLAASDLRIDKHFYKSYSIDHSIEEINSNLYKYNTNCRPLARLDINPTNRHTGTIQVSMPGLSDTSVIVVMDFEQVGDNKTNVKSYTYYPSWNSFPDKVIDAINGGPCPS